MMKIAAAVERRLASIQTPLTVALMGCMVNGPGEAKEADIGLACGKKAGVLFKRGKLCRRIKEERIVPEFVKEVEKMAVEVSRTGKRRERA